MRRTARVLSAEGRLSAWVLGALPVGFVALLLVLRPEQLAPLVSDARGDAGPPGLHAVHHRRAVAYAAPWPWRSDAAQVPTGDNGIWRHA